METTKGIRMCHLVTEAMLEFVLIAVLHLDGDIRGPVSLIDIYPTMQECIEGAVTAQDIVYDITMEWHVYRDEQRSIGNEVPSLISIGMLCKPMSELQEEIQI